MTCNYEASFSVDNYVTYIEGKIPAAVIFWTVGGGIITCAQKLRNYVAANNVPVALLPRTVIHKTVFFAHIMRQMSVALISLTIPLSLELLASYWMFCPSHVSSLRSRI